MDSPWLLLIYTVPAEPSRKRAFIWRLLKRVGAIYLHDGVCVLPQMPAAALAFSTIATRVLDFGGRATMVKDARLDEDLILEVKNQMAVARAAEYDAIRHDAEGFLEHIRREGHHRNLGLEELDGLRGDLRKMRRWHEQVRSRDYFSVGDSAALTKIIRDCEEEVSQFAGKIPRQESLP